MLLWRRPQIICLSFQIEGCVAGLERHLSYALCLFKLISTFCDMFQSTRWFPKQQFGLWAPAQPHNIDNVIRLWFTPLSGCWFRTLSTVCVVLLSQGRLKSLRLQWGSRLHVDPLQCLCDQSHCKQGGLQVANIVLDILSGVPFQWLSKNLKQKYLKLNKSSAGGLINTA